jgi:hypothetical protein
MLRAFVGAGFAAMPRVEINEAAAPATRAVEKIRLFIVMTYLPSIVEFLAKLLERDEQKCKRFCASIPL